MPFIFNDEMSEVDDELFEELLETYEEEESNEIDDELEQ